MPQWRPCALRAAARAPGWGSDKLPIFDSKVWRSRYKGASKTYSQFGTRVGWPRFPITEKNSQRYLDKADLAVALTLVTGVEFCAQGQIKAAIRAVPTNLSCA
jgi:hypothetical protein